MATPILTLNTTPLPTMHYSTPQVLDFGIVKDSAGAPIDISSGWTAKFSLLNTDTATGGGHDTTGTFSYGADGALKLTVTQAQAIQYLTGNYQALVALSDDSFATQSTHQGGSFRVQRP